MTCAYKRSRKRQVAEADTALADLVTHAAANNATTIAEVYAMRGNTEQALKWLARAFENGEGWASSWIGDAMLVGLPDYQRYGALGHADLHAEAYRRHP